MDTSNFKELAEPFSKDNQLKLSLAFNSAIDPMWLIRMDSPNIFHFETINTAFTQVTGWTAEQVEGQPIEKIMPEASHELVRTKYNEALNSGKIIDYIEEARHPSGIKFGEIRVIPIRGKSGEPMRILGIANDITEKVILRKRLDEEKELRNRHITSAAIRGQESERAKVSRELHDNVNQVLTTIKLYIELLIDEKVDDSVLPKCVAYLNSTINEIRDLSKQLSAPSIGKMNFKETLGDLVESVRAATQADISLRFGTLGFLEMENELHLALYRVAQEQLTNVMKYANANYVDVSLSEREDFLIFSITDDGVGFNELEKRQGIGITNMQSRIEIINGQFQIKSSPGSGTQLKVEIPVRIEDNICYIRNTTVNSLPI